VALRHQLWLALPLSVVTATNAGRRESRQFWNVLKTGMSPVGDCLCSSRSRKNKEAFSEILFKKLIGQ
jgi:hypothetical protein